MKTISLQKNFTVNVNATIGVCYEVLLHFLCLSSSINRPLKVLNDRDEMQYSELREGKVKCFVSLRETEVEATSNDPSHRAVFD